MDRRNYNSIKLVIDWFIDWMTGIIMCHRCNLVIMLQALAVLGGSFVSEGGEWFIILLSL